MAASAINVTTHTITVEVFDDSVVYYVPLILAIYNRCDHHERDYTASNPAPLSFKERERLGAFHHALRIRQVGRSVLQNNRAAGKSTVRIYYRKDARQTELPSNKWLDQEVVKMVKRCTPRGSAFVVDRPHPG